MSTWTHRALALLLPLSLALLPSRGEALPAEEGSAPAVFHEYVKAMSAAAAKMSDAMMTFHRNEYVAGEGMNGPQVIHMKYLRAPTSIYMRWQTPTPGREVLWVQGQNDGDMWISASRMLPTLSLDPRGSVAMEGSRNAIMDSSLHRIYGIIAKDTETVRAHPTWVPEVEDLGASTLYGQAVRCFKTFTPKDKDPTLYAYRTDLCFSEASKLPLRIQAYDKVNGTVRLVEDYGYEDMRVNVGLSATDFSDENPKYSF
ncbi:MAG: DUF1571 domain-containing protein [Alphaproteobacteria bacterium]|nr:DUF1571 domain-containing protein [Alphaproteobacteria bacterium]